MTGVDTHCQTYTGMQRNLNEDKDKDNYKDTDNYKEKVKDAGKDNYKHKNQDKHTMVRRGPHA